MAKDKDLVVQRNKTLPHRNGRTKQSNHLRLLASKHVLRKASPRARPTDWR